MKISVGVPELQPMFPLEELDAKQNYGKNSPF